MVIHEGHFWGWSLVVYLFPSFNLEYRAITAIIEGILPPFERLKPGFALTFELWDGMSLPMKNFGR